MRRALIVAIIVVMCAILGISIWQIAAYIRQSREGEALYDGLAAILEQQAAQPQATSPPGQAQSASPTARPEASPTAQAAQQGGAEQQAAAQTPEPTAYAAQTAAAGGETASPTAAWAPADTPRPQETAAQTAVSPEATAPVFVLEEEVEAAAAEADDGLLPEYRAFVELNPDMVGWLTIEGTPVHYPVVQRAGDDEYYVHRDFFGNDAAYGCLFVQATCDVRRPSDNVVIYGHNMRDNSMFGILDEYKRYEFYEEHPTFRFDTIWEKAEYEIIAVFRTYVYSESASAFKYYQFIDAKDEAEFDKAIERCRRLSFYDIPAEVHYGDSIVMLSTCEYSQANGRFVVVGRKITGGSGDG